MPDISATPMRASEPGTRAAVADMHAAAIAAGVLPLWTITFDPIDCPGLYVARMHVAGAGVGAATSAAVSGFTLEEVRAVLPPGMIRFERFPNDDPVIVESWL